MHTHTHINTIMYAPKKAYCCFSLQAIVSTFPFL